MRPVINPRGPLPARVYWTRRLLLLAVALLLVVGLARLLDPTGGSAPEQASPAAAPASSSVPSETPPAVQSSGNPTADSWENAEAQARTEKRQDPKKGPSLPEPDGPCDPADVLITPTITQARENQPIRIVLELTTQESRACTWEVSPRNVFVMISSDEGPLWTSQHCPDVMPTQPVVPRREHVDRVKLWWNGMESDQKCSRNTPWVRAGTYTVTAVARGSVTPVETDFELDPFERETVTPTPTPSESPSKGSPDDKGSG